MEKFVDSGYLDPKDTDTNAQKNAACGSVFCLSVDTNGKYSCRKCCKISRVDQEIASQKQASGFQSTTCNGMQERTRRQEWEKKVNVLKKSTTETVRRSVQKKTKINKSNVPDRLGKYVSYSVSFETKLTSNDGVGPEESSSLSLSPSSRCVSGDGEREGEGEGGGEGEEGYKKTKIALLGNECLSNKEADRLRNSFESDLEKKNIFENFFGNCLDSTTKGKGVSSQEYLGERRRESEERTPEKTRTQTSPPRAPVKIRDHSSYYSSPKNVRHVCEYCHKIFKSNGKLNSHVYSHTGERPFDCNHCGKAFSSKFKLVRHLLIHSEIRKFVCQICDRTFLRNDHLKNHYKVHDPQKKMYKCPKENCDKEYSSVMSHKKHMAYHNVEDGDLKCLICNVKYETKDEVLFHLKSHSGSRLFKTQSDKKFKCDFCDRLFLTRKDVTRHLVVHTGERDFLCQFCPQRFGRKDHLVRHIKKSHGNEDLMRNDDARTASEDGRKQEDGKGHGRSSRRAVAALKNSEFRPVPENRKETCHAMGTSGTNDTNETNRTEDNKTHIFITVQGKALQNRKRQKLHKKPFQKNEMLVPRKKQVPLTKGKSSTTQILLQSVPNIVIIPNNSIILLRNQAAAKKDFDGPPDSSPPRPVSLAPPPFPSPPIQPPCSNATNEFINVNYDSTNFPSPSELFADIPLTDTFCNFHPDLPSFPAQFDEPDFAVPGNLFPEVPRPPSPPPPSPSPSPRSPDPLPPRPQSRHLDFPPPSAKNKVPYDADDCGDALLLHEAILGGVANFREDAAPTAPTPEEDGGGMSDILTQGNDNCGFELLRHLLTAENPVLSPLPGFSQIFNNSNANSN